MIQRSVVIEVEPSPAGIQRRIAQNVCPIPLDIAEMRVKGIKRRYLHPSDEWAKRWLCLAGSISDRT
jgi:hypothetical protein